MRQPLKFGLLSALALTASPLHAAITVVAEFRLGEAGSMAPTTLNPLDSATSGSPSGNQHFTNDINGSSASTSSAGVFAPGSSVYLDTTSGGNEGWFDASNSLASGALASDNFAFGIYARASSLGGTQGDIFTLGGSAGSFKLSLENNGWGASSHFVSWIGPSDGVSGSFIPDAWVHLALVRNSGTTTFYIDGVAQGTYSGAPIHDAMHLSVSPGGAVYFDGHLDEARIVTFEPSDAGLDNANVLQSLQGVPEVHSALLGCLGAMTLLRRRRISEV